VLLDEATLVMPLADLVDVEQERQRLQKEIGRLDQELDSLDKKLNKPDFLEKAPVHVVEDARQRRADADAAKRKLQTALERLS
jgi:valyl-tRNA synthetase